MARSFVAVLKLLVVFANIVASFAFDMTIIIAVWMDPIVPCISFLGYICDFPSANQNL